jgi:hypothetical protein
MPRGDGGKQNDGLEIHIEHKSEDQENNQTDCRELHEISLEGSSLDLAPVGFARAGDNTGKARILALLHQNHDRQCDAVDDEQRHEDKSANISNAVSKHITIRLQIVVPDKLYRISAPLSSTFLSHTANIIENAVKAKEIPPEKDDLSDGILPMFTCYN